ncbi:MAG: sensor histidine kinase [Micromonosporaceae bacterium]|jgi:signal transduction histidine kinase|nr:sensor histidine kinase [Micromonosporaceae bacterium]
MAVRAHLLLQDALLALVLAAIGLGGTRGAAELQHTSVDALGFALVVAAAATLTLRRVWPLATLAGATGATSAYLLLGNPYGPVLISFAVAVFTVANRLPARRAAIASGVALLVLLLHSAVGRSPVGWAGLVPGSAWVAVPFAVGLVMRVTREANARARAEQAREYAYEERLRIAQEVHDVVGHGLAAINMQAEIALHLLPKRPEQAGEALSAISRTSKEALDELRATLAVVRRSDPSGVRAPTPGLARLGDLVDRMSATGVPVTVEVTGTPRDLPAAVDLAAYRLVQESLTNVLRHAGQASATVRVAHEPDRLTVTVTDTGRGAPAAPNAGGHGIRGMRERVTALGGVFEAGPAPAGGFRVQGSFPL